MLKRFFNNRKAKIKVLVVIILLMLLLPALVVALKGASSSYSIWSKFGFGGQTGNTSSSNYEQREISGEQPVSQYSSSNYTGRFGILEDTAGVTINVSTPLNNVEIFRGKDDTNEDDLGLVSDTQNILTDVFVTDTNAGVPDINVSFYFNETYLSSNLTNNSGTSSHSFDKTNYQPGYYNITNNYSTTSYSKDVNVSSVNVTLVSINIPNFAGNRGGATQYVWNQTVIFYFNVTKNNGTINVFYDPLNLTANATDTTDKPYPEAVYVDGFRVKRNDVGQYETRVLLNQSLLDADYTNFIRWKVYLSDDTWESFIGTALHTDVALVDGPICGNSIVEGPETCDDGNTASGDGCSATCTSEGGDDDDGGGGDDCDNECLPSGAVQEVCVTGTTLRTQTCGNYDTDSCLEWGNSQYEDCLSGEVCELAECTLGDCGEWQCGEWSQCFYGDLNDYYPEGSSLNLGTALVAPFVLNKETLFSSSINENLIRKSLFDEFEKLGLRITGEAIAINDASCDSIDDLENARCNPSRERYVQECTLRQRRGQTQFYWKDVRLPRGMVCSQGQPVCSEENSCEINGENVRQCSTNTKYQTCELDENGCLKWSRVESVPRGMVCENGEATCSAENSCEIDGEDARQCRNEIRTQTCEPDRNGCLKWVNSDRCARGEICTDGTCLLPHCTDGLQNSDETGVDCGGTDCESCLVEEICDNGIDDNENGLIDCFDASCENSEVCIVQEPVCGDGKIDLVNNEICDDKNLKDLDGCSSICQTEDGWTCAGEPSVCIEISVEPTNETLVNVTVEDEAPSVEIDQYVVEIGETINIQLNKGDDVSVTYEEQRDNFVVIRVKTVSTANSDEAVTEFHTVKVEEVGEGKIIVTVETEPITKDIGLGETVIFDLPTTAATQGNDYIQTRTCTSVNPLCELLPRTEARFCQEGEGICEVDLQCSWTVCTEEDEYSYPYNCYDKNSCGTGFDLPEKVLCGEQPEEYPECSGVWQCSDWGQCEILYEIDDVLANSLSKEGHRSRTCFDAQGLCIDELKEFASCDAVIPIDARKVEWCYDEYVEIYERDTGNLVSKIKESQVENFEELTRIDISIVTTDFVGVCDYCYNGVKDFDETGVDCGGPSCPVCVQKAFFFNWLFWMILISWILLMLLLLLLLMFLCKRRKEKHKKPCKKVIKDFFRNLIAPRKEEVRLREWKIEQALKKIGKGIIKVVVLPGKLLALPFRIKVTRKPERERAERVVSIRKEKVPFFRRIRIPVFRPNRKLARLKRKLRIWREQGYAGTSKLESKIRELESRTKKEVIYGTKLVKRYKEKERKITERVKRKKIMLAKKEERKRKRLQRKEKRKEFKIFKKKIRREKKIIRREKKEKRRIRKRKIRKLSREILRKRAISLMRKLRLWRKEGYYGTAKLETELRKLKEHGD